MKQGGDKGMLLGRNVPAVEAYSPEILHAVPRRLARESLGLHERALPFSGEDIWHAYEISWLDAAGKPVVRLGRIRVPADSANLVESKSIKLYLNSLNGERYAHEEAVAAMIARDLSAVAEGEVSCTLFEVDDPEFAGSLPKGDCIDELQPTGIFVEPAREILRSTGEETEQALLYSNLLRSLCPVTGQPDWATLCIDYAGAELDRASLLAYVISFRRHQEFHEQCVERIFCDLLAVCAPAKLSVQALYTRRGGLDICPWRSTGKGPAPALRTNRQ
jgi:7-cyano-7-deazaguanine reductase